MLFLLAMFGGFTLLLTFIPQQAFYPMVIFIGLDIFSGTFGHIEPRHMSAMGIGLLPGSPCVGARAFVCVCTRTLSALALA